MTKYKNDQEYLSIVNSIMENKDFSKMGELKHHNTTRMNHLVKVSYYSYKIAKGLRLEYRDVARAGLLHDFYVEEIDECPNFKEKLKLFTYGHPNNAIENSKRITTLTPLEEDIIKTHMFPADYRVPVYAESWIVSIVDKVLSIGECSRKFGLKAAYVANLYLIFMINVLK